MNEETYEDKSSLIGKVIHLPTGITVTPTRYTSGYAMNCQVLRSTHPSYPRGGYDISVSIEKLKAGLEVDLGVAVGDTIREHMQRFCTTHYLVGYFSQGMAEARHTIEVGKRPC